MRKVRKKMTNILLLIRGLPPTFEMNHAGPRQALPNPDCFLVAQPVAEPLYRRGRRCLILMKCENPCQSSQKRVGVAVLRGVLQPEAPKGFYRRCEGFGMDMPGLACPFSLHGANLLLNLLPARFNLNLRGFGRRRFLTGGPGEEGGNVAVQDLWLWRPLALVFGLVDLGWNGQALQETTGHSSSLVVYLPSATLLLQDPYLSEGPLASILGRRDDA